MNNMNKHLEFKLLEEENSTINTWIFPFIETPTALT